MTPPEAREALRLRSSGLVEIAPVQLASHLVAIVCAVRPPPSDAIDRDGLARFNCRIDEPTWQAIKVLIDDHFERQEVRRD